MKTISECPICGGAPAARWPGLVAPFIAELALQGTPSACALLECGTCAFRYFDRRFEAGELDRIYSGYRGEAYFQARHGFEPWYTRRHNEGTGHDPSIQAERKAYLSAFLRQHGHGPVQRILDFGGDSGQFIPEDLGTERHVYEVSNAEPVAGVRKITREEELEPGSYDLILLNHVLEHVPDPLSLLEKLAELLKPGTGSLYIEVPDERHRIWSGTGAIQRAYLEWLARHGRMLQAADFYSTLSRVVCSTIPPLGFPKLHEHINYFEQISIGKSCHLAGLDLIACQGAKRTDAKVLSALARSRPILAAIPTRRDAASPSS